ncbi:UNVERIFIED_CONTAM: coenzyme F420-reducing hydrogenase beta subunit [Acetivibrio alkalicellulosi]
MKKVALMTWSQYHNFGTSLQVTASTYTMRKLGYEVDVINYMAHGKLVTLKDYKDINHYIRKIRKKIKSKKSKSIFDEARETAFHNFLDKNISLTEECKTDSDLFLLNEKYDAFVCGSDQIWSPSNFNAKYFLNFVEDPQKMIAYAPSIGLSKIEDIYVKNRMEDNISRFVHLSIREEEGAKLIKEICNKEAKVVLDPTLLLTSNEWDTMNVSVGKSKPYILCYFLGNNANNWSHVYKLSKTTNIPLRIVPVFRLDYERGYSVVDGVGPGEFLSLVKNASFICTDSFHGTAFSIIYNKPFYAYERFTSKDENNQNSRIYNILKLFELESRLVRDTKKISNHPLDCDYAISNMKLEKKRKESKEYLENSLNEAINANKTREFKITNTCCGCGVCSIVCPKKAIEIKRDKKGFLKSFLDQDICIKCKKCKTVCPFSNKTMSNIDKDIHNLYMLKSTDKNVLETTASGGAGFEIAKYLSIDGYDVVGCFYDKEKAEAIHKIVNSGDVIGLNVFKGSKYLQSNTKDVFAEVFTKLRKTVIFGTPCQITGIDLLLKSKNKRENYILVDLICHGVPSQNLWYKYLKEGSKRYGYGISPDVKFRDKSKGWRDKFIHIVGNSKSYLSNESKDLFYRFFLLRHSNMEACYECNFRTRSSADIRIGDYWGPRYKDEKDGVSMVIAITKVGNTILRNLKVHNIVELEKKEAIDYWTVQCPQNPIKPAFYDELIKDICDETKSLEETLNNYCKGFEFYRKIYKIFKKLKS